MARLTWPRLVTPCGRAVPKPCAASAMRRAAAAERKLLLPKCGFRLPRHRQQRPIVQPRRYALIQQFGHLVIPRCGLISMIRCAAMPLESDLYAPVKALLEGQGYVVKGEVRGCDVVAVRGQEPPVIVELKRVFGLGLVLQGVDRLALSDRVYLAVGQWPKRMKNVKKLCRRLGLGLMVVVARSAPTSCSIPCPTGRGSTSARPAVCWASTRAASAIPIAAARPRGCR